MSEQTINITARISAMTRIIGKISNSGGGSGGNSDHITKKYTLPPFTEITSQTYEYKEITE
ncbi:MAG: hypothetical protein PUG48_01885 [Clostridia bacterium]|nr:hypothetical protein [Clostridia bacterium]